MTVIEMARELGKVIQESDEYKTLAAARQASDDDGALQDKIGQFNLIRMKMDIESGKPEPDEQKIKELNDQLLAVYNEIMESDEMVAFNQAKETIDALMNQVTSILSAAVNGEDPATFDPNACTGSCATCGGCG